MSNKRISAEPGDALPHIQALTTSVDHLAGLAMPQKVEKRWGHELIYFNDYYCMKMLQINHGHKTSMHFHVHKHETLLVTHGVLTLKYKDGRGQDHVVEIPEDNAFVIPPGFQHQLCAQDGLVRLVEASTPDNELDSIRVNM